MSFNLRGLIIKIGNIKIGNESKSSTKLVVVLDDKET